MNHVTNRIIEIRRARGFTQTDLGDRMGVSTQWVNRREKGHTPITLADVETFAAGLCVSSSVLFEQPLSATLPPMPEA